MSESPADDPDADDPVGTVKHLQPQKYPQLERLTKALGALHYREENGKPSAISQHGVAYEKHEFTVRIGPDGDPTDGQVNELLAAAINHFGRARDYHSVVVWRAKPSIIIRYDGKKRLAVLRFRYHGRKG